MLEPAENVAQVVHLMAAVHDTEISPDRLRAYIATLSDIDPDRLRAAALRYIERNTYPRIATPGELRQLAVELVTEAAGLLDAPAAWGEVMHQLRYAGSWRTPHFSSPLIERAVDDIGGWYYLCGSENVAADRARFIEAYGQRLQRQAREMAQLPASTAYREQLAATNGTPTQRIAALADGMRIR